MNLQFKKYQGTGNDFIIVDNRSGDFIPAKELIERMCNRRFGIGADGVIVIEECTEASFAMHYYNSDGNISTMCGNGGRCASSFAYYHNIAPQQHTFMAADGLHTAMVKGDIVELSLNDTGLPAVTEAGLFIDTGSPHLVVFADDIAGTEIAKSGKELRHSPLFAPGGTNVNFAAAREGLLYIRTYERGVEGETLSCGTGATAAAICSVFGGHFDIKEANSIEVRTIGGRLTVSFKITDGMVKDVMLEGSANLVYEGVASVSRLS